MDFGYWAFRCNDGDLLSFFNTKCLLSYITRYSKKSFITKIRTFLRILLPENSRYPPSVLLFTLYSVFTRRGTFNLIK